MSPGVTINSPVDAFSIGYIKIIKGFLTIFASWPYQVAGGKVHPAYKLYGRLVVAVGMVAVSGQIWFLIDNFNVLSFVELGQTYLTCFLTTLALMYEKIEWLTQRAVVIEMFLGVLAPTLLNMIPIMNNIRSGAFRDPNKTIEFGVSFSYPGFDPQNHYKFVTICNFYVSYCCGILIAGIDALILLFVIHIIGHIGLLHNTLMTFPKPGNPTNKFKTGFERTTKPANLTTTMYTLEENIMIKDKIKQFVEHHLLIVRFTDDVSAFFGPVIAFYYLFHQVSGCVVLLELSAGGAEALTRYAPLTVAIFGQLIIISVIFEIVNTKSCSKASVNITFSLDWQHVTFQEKSEKLADAVYGVPWESMSVSNQRSVCILLQRLQTPIALTALGIIGVNVNTMSKILKTSFSYFTFLRTLNE